MTWITFDIETAPNPLQMARLIANPPKFKATRSKLPASVEKEIAGKKEAWEKKLPKTCSTTPHLGLIASCAFHDFEDRSAVFALSDYAGRVAPFGDYSIEELLGAERKLVGWIWSWLCQYDRIVVWNGLQFDVSFQDRRSIVHKIKSDVNLATPRYRYSPVCDLKMYWTDWNQYSKDEKLEDVAAALGIKGEKAAGSVRSGADVYPALLEGRWEEVKQYNQNEMGLMAKVAERIFAYSCLLGGAGAASTAKADSSQKVGG